MADKDKTAKLSVSEIEKLIADIPPDVKHENAAAWKESMLKFVEQNKERLGTQGYAELHDLLDDTGVSSDDLSRCKAFFTKLLETTKAAEAAAKAAPAKPAEPAEPKKAKEEGLHTRHRGLGE